MRDQKIHIPSKVRVRRELCADALYATLRRQFAKIPDHHRTEDVEISLSDALMSGFAMFSLKDPSLLVFDYRRKRDAHNLTKIYGIETIPCDTQMRKIIDGVASDFLRPSFRSVFGKLQRGKALEPMVFFEGYYLLNLDGTQYFSSEKLHSDFCLQKTNSKTGKITYYLQMLGAAIVHPDFKEVIPLCPEPIIKQDGQTKNDCERNAAKRFFEKLRKEHPHLKLIVNEDALSPNAPHIRDLKKHDLRFILGVKPGDHEFLFNEIEKAAREGRTTEFGMEDPKDPKIAHYFRFLNGVPLNESNQDILVNVLEYWEIREDGTHPYSWITDFTITRENAFTLMRGGRARWKIENETFNTLKNQGYNFEHNYGLGKKYLSINFILLMMLAFLVDQAQQLTCALFRSVWKELRTKKSLWDNVRAIFRSLEVDSMEMIYRMILYGYEKTTPVLFSDSS
jgi:hypothetical protein